MLDRRRFMQAAGTFALTAGGCGGGDGTFLASNIANLRAVAAALLRFQADGHPLPKDVVAPDGTSLWSWRVRLLPYLNLQDTYAQLKLTEPWDSPHNSRWTDRPVDGLRWSGDPPNTTRFLAVNYAGTLFPNIEAVRDKESNARRLLLVAVGPDYPVPWASPGDLDFSSETRAAAHDKLPLHRVPLAFADGHVEQLPQRPTAADVLTLLDSDGDGSR